MSYCQALDPSGRICGKRRDLKLVRYHGDPEIYGFSERAEPCWVRVRLCPEHRRPDDPKPGDKQP